MLISLPHNIDFLVFSRLVNTSVVNIHFVCEYAYLQRRLDRLAETGLELFVTDFGVGSHDEVVRTDWFEDAMRAYFAHPGLSGVVLSGFLKEQKEENKNMFLVDSNLLLNDSFPPGKKVSAYDLSTRCSVAIFQMTRSKCRYNLKNRCFTDETQIWQTCLF